MGVHDPSERVFLSVIAWPDATRREKEALLEEAGAADPGASRDIASMRNRVALQPPMVLGSIGRAPGLRLCDAIRARDGDAFCCSLSDLEALGPTLKIRDLELVDGDLGVTLWRGPETIIRRESVRCLVRAHLSESVVIRTPHNARVSQLHFVGHMPPSVRDQFIRDATSRRVRTSDKLDIHTDDGSVFQLDGDKFGYRVLGDMRGHSDKANMDRMFELLQHLAGQAIADMYFPLWKPPPGFDQLRIPHAKLNRDEPDFAFHSRWVARMYRHILDHPA